MELFVGQAGVFEMKVVEDRVFDVGGGKIGGERLLPDALRHPHALDFRAEPQLKPIGIGRDLSNAVARRDHCQDRLVERTADDLNAAGSDQAAKTVDVFRMPLVEPLHERPASMQRDGKIVLLKNVEKKLIRVLVGLLEDAVEVADRLVVVQDEAKTNRIHGRYYRHNTKGFRLQILDFRPQFLALQKIGAKS